MPRTLQTFLLGCIAVAFAFLVIHAHEPLRLNIGDPEADANVLTSIGYVESNGVAGIGIADVGPLTEDSFRDPYTPVTAQVLYGVLGGYLGLDSLFVLRLISIAFSATAMLLLFLYARRMWTTTVALVATMLFSTSLLWTTHADSLNGAPILQASAFLTLWGLVRALETKQRRHAAVGFLGACVCYLSGFDYWLFLPVAALFTVNAKAGPSKLVWIVLVGCFAGFLIKVQLVGWHELGLELDFVRLERTASTIGLWFESPLSTLVRRYTLIFTPLFWLTVLYVVWRAVRGRSIRAVATDGLTWMLVVAFVFLVACQRFVASQMIASQVLLPFYALGSAVVIGRLLDEQHVFRRLFGLVWVAVAPLWSLYFLVSQPRALVDEGDVAKANAYFASHDRNDFVMTNLMSDAVIHSAFGRHRWEALDSTRVAAAPLAMLDLLALTGTDYVHVVVFTTQESRLLDRSLWELGMQRRLWALTGWPQLMKEKTGQVIEESDGRVHANLNAVGATRVLDLGLFDVYRIDRAALLQAAADRVPVIERIDLGSVTSSNHLLLGWDTARLDEENGRAIASINGFFPCPNPEPASLPGEPRGNACKTLYSQMGVSMMDQARRNRAELMIRVERSCDLRITIELGWSSLVELSMNGYTEAQCIPANTVTFVVPQRAVRAGINTIALEGRFTPVGERVEISSITIVPLCIP